ncbi:MAG: zinc-ribbon domain, partial [Candidatus Aminicenantes bacterium]|nr:zinc-ribbon domain [Candidatus Aminicenantes bacterium]
MAIIRCPYCHAIIDENDKYCNNCGTQLLFTEDEAVEEEIPGEKIIDADVEEKDYTVDEPGDEKRPAAPKDLDTEIDEDLERELREETEEMALDELVAEETGGEAGDEVTEEVILVDEIAASEAKAKDGSRELAEEDTAEPKKPGEETEEEDDKEEKEQEEEKDKDEED